ATGDSPRLGARSHAADRTRRCLPQKGAQVVCADNRSTTKTEPRLRRVDTRLDQYPGGRPTPSARAGAVRLAHYTARPMVRYQPKSLGSTQPPPDETSHRQAIIA